MDEETSGTIEIQQYVSLLIRWAWLIVLATLLGAGAAYLASRLSTPIYEASATLLITEGQKATGQDYNSILMSERVAKTYAQMLKGSPVLAEAKARLGVGIEPGSITVEPVRDTQLLRVRVRHADPALAASIANTIPQAFIEQTEDARAARIASSQANLTREMQALQAELLATQRALDAARDGATPNAAEVARLEALLAQQRSTYASLLQNYEEIRLSELRAADTISIFEPAQVPEAPVLPRTMTNVLLAAVVGAMLAVGAAFLIEYLDDTVKTPADVQRLAGLSTFATILRFAGDEADAERPLMASRPSSAAGEAYRVLRTNLQFATLGMGRSAVAVLVTSAAPQEGKTTTAVNLGISLAQAGKRVLLVDTDLRRPTLHKQFGLANDAGLTSLYLTDMPLEEAVRETDIPGLSVLTSGPIPANPAEVLSFPQTEQLLQRLRSMADYLLLDSPPVLSVADACILAQRVDGVLLVAEMGRTRAGAFKDVTEALEGVQARVLGVVLNKVREGRSGYYYHYYYHYYYSSDGKRVRRRRRVLPGGRRNAQAQATGNLPGAPTSLSQTRAALIEQQERNRRLKYAGLGTGGVAALLAVGMAAAELLGAVAPGAAEPAASTSAHVLHEAPAAGTEVPPATEPAPAPTSTTVTTPARPPATPTAPPTRVTATRAPTAAPRPTPTFAPTATAPVAAPHGVIGRLRLRDARKYAVGEPVPFVLELENTGDAPVSLGIVGLKADQSLPFHWSWTELTIQPHTVFTAEDSLAFPAPGVYNVKQGVCFSATGACASGSGEWAEYEPAVAVTVG